MSRVVVGGATSRALGVSSYVSFGPQDRLAAFTSAAHRITGAHSHQVKVTWEWHDKVEVVPSQLEPILLRGISTKRSFSRVWKADETVAFWAPQTVWSVPSGSQ